MAAAFVVGCSDAEKAKLSSYGNMHKIELYSGGELVRTWYSTGKVISEADSDGYYFMDYETKRIKEVSGTVVIDTMPDGFTPEK
jgi:hypothetical protein